MTTQTYYYLPLDSNNQPNGDVCKIELTREEFLNYKKWGNLIYDNETEADRRAQC